MDNTTEPDFLPSFETVVEGHEVDWAKSPMTRKFITVRISGHRRVVPLTKLIEADTPPRNLGFSSATVADEWPQGRKALKTV